MLEVLLVGLAAGTGLGVGLQLARLSTSLIYHLTMQYVQRRDLKDMSCDVCGFTVTHDEEGTYSAYLLFHEHECEDI